VEESKLMSLDSIFSEDWPEDHKSGIVAVVGRPNVGKSTLINAILGQKVAITTPKPQTTRRNQLGIYTTEKMQILFTDTPGLHKARNTLGEYMMAVAEQALKDADVIVWILDVSDSPQKADEYIAETIKAARGNRPLLLVLNKTDLVPNKQDFSPYTGIIEHQAAFPLSASKGTGVQSLIDAIAEMLPLGPRYYPPDEVSDLSMRFTAAEVIREKVILSTEEEIPHSVAVEITEYKDKEERTEIFATIYVEKDSQKGIIIGKGGAMIKKIGTEARKDLEEMIERQIFLDLHVKVLKNWRENEKFVARVGYKMPKKDED
jgi:GTPase